MSPENLEARLRDVERQLAVLWEWRSEVMARNRAIPGWLIAAAGVALPLIGSLITMWLAGRVRIP